MQEVWLLVPMTPSMRIYISAENMNGAMHNDRVIVRLLHHGHTAIHPLREVYKILQQANKTLVERLKAMETPSWFRGSG